MTIRTIVVVVLALVCGASFSVGVLKTSGKTQPTDTGSVNTKTVVVAAQPLPRFHRITEVDLELRACSEEWVTEETLTNVEDAVGKVASENLFAGDVLTNAKLTAEGVDSCVAVSIKPGMRAYTIQTSRIASNVAGFIMPGNKVDVLLNMKGSRGDVTGGGSTTTLLQAIEVLAVAQHTEAPDNYKVDPKEVSSVTLHVNPQQVCDLDLGQNQGILTLSLRNPEDDAPVETIPSTVADCRFLGDLGQPAGMIDEPRPPVEELILQKEPDPITIVTLRGRHRGLVSLNSGRGY